MTTQSKDFLVSLTLVLSHRLGSRGSRYEHATGCASDGCSGYPAASGRVVAKVHLPLSCGPPYSSASGMAVCSLALLSDAHLVFELKLQRKKKSFTGGEKNVINIPHGFMAKVKLNGNPADSCSNLNAISVHK